MSNSIIKLRNLVSNHFKNINNTTTVVLNNIEDPPNIKELLEKIEAKIKKLSEDTTMQKFGINDITNYPKLDIVRDKIQNGYTRETNEKQIKRLAEEKKKEEEATSKAILEAKEAILEAKEANKIESIVKSGATEAKNNALDLGNNIFGKTIYVFTHTDEEKKKEKENQEEKARKAKKAKEAYNKLAIEYLEINNDDNEKLKKERETFMNEFKPKQKNKLILIITDLVNDPASKYYGDSIYFNPLKVLEDD